MIGKKLEKKIRLLFPESSAHLNGAGDLRCARTRKAVFGKRCRVPRAILYFDRAMSRSSADLTDLSLTIR